MKAFLVGLVHEAVNEQKSLFKVRTQQLEREGYVVHLPHRDTDQNATFWNICQENRRAIEESDVIEVLYDPNS